MKKTVLIAALIAFGLTVFMGSSTALAHDGEVELSFSGFYDQTVLHDPDEYPWKGWFLATVTNTSSEPWGDFHFQLIRNIGWGTPSEVIFTDTGNSFEIIGRTNYTYAISPDGLAVDFYFYSTNQWVNPNDTVTFKVYTDNTANQQPFGMLLFPTPVPEPITMSLLAFGGLALLRRRV